MRILYLGVHYHKNITEWRSETWINKSFHNNDIDTLRIDYREVIKKYGK